ncbi:spore maturation protein SpmA [Bacillaceae bacterium]
MVNAIWFALLLLGVIAAGVNGKMEVISQAAFEGAKAGVTVSFGLISILAFWLGMMRIAEKSGLLRAFTGLMRPAVRFLFPEVPRDHPALGYILSNLAANLFGLGNAATPMGIKAMQELKKLHPNSEEASPAMCTLLALNTSGVTLIPATIIAIRINFGSANPVEIVGTTLFASAVGTAVAILLDKWYRFRRRKRRGR